VSSPAVDIDQTDFMIVCASCGSVSIKFACTREAPSSIVECGRCGAPRGSAAAFRNLVRDGKTRFLEC